MTTTPNTTEPTIVGHQEWVEARQALLADEKALMRQHDELAAKRRAMPWRAVDAGYTFEGPEGQVALADLFDGKSQLAIYHFMMGPDWEVGCPSCSYWADSFNGIEPHLRDRDVNLVAISRAPIADIEGYKTRMGWGFPWYSSLGSPFNVDFEVSFGDDAAVGGEPQTTYNYAPVGPGPEERHGFSAFIKSDDGQIFHTYSTFARGAEVFNAAYSLLDLMPKGRSESEFEFPMAWVRRHDEY